MFHPISVWYVISVVFPGYVCGSCSDRTIITFNVGLTPFIPNYQTRGQLMSDALKNTVADVVCLQEVWFERDMKRIVTGVRDVFPYSWSTLHFSTRRLRRFPRHSRYLTPPSCTADDPATEIFVKCVLQNCPSSATYVFCVVTACLAQLFAMPQNCVSCSLLASSDSFFTVLDQCFGCQGDNRMNLEGLLVLSKHKIECVRSARYIPGVKQIFPRGYLEVEIDDIGTVVCTHLTANLSQIYLEAIVQEETGISSWEEQQAAEIQTLISTFSDPHVLAGDLNTGPAIPSSSIVAELPANYDTLVASGYYDDFVVRDGTECTFCIDNPLPFALTRNKTIDHVMVKGVSVTSSRRVLETYSGVTLSDHYGVETVVCTESNSDWRSRFMTFVDLPYSP